MTARANGAAVRVAPGPGGHPIRDQLQAFERDPLRFLEETHHAYGDVVRVHLWPNLYHLVNHPEGVRHVLATHKENYHWVPEKTYGRQRLSGEMREINEAAKLQRMHRLSVQVAHRHRVRAYAVAMTAAVEEMLDRWERHAASGERLDVSRELVRLALTILGDTLFGVDLREELDSLAPALAVYVEQTAPQKGSSVLQLLQAEKMQPANVAAAMHTIQNLITRLIDERRASGRHGGDLLSILALDVDEETGALLHPDDLLEVVRVFLIAGHSAVADAVGWTLYLLSEHPAAQARVRVEVDVTLGGRVPTAASLPRLRYGAMVLQEAMRLYPPVWMFAPRMASRDDVIQGYRIAAGSLILISPWVFHRCADFWELPLAFRPERFVSPPPAAYYPFGAGPWGCLGGQFGMVEAHLVLAMVAQRFSWELLPGHPVEPDPQLSLRPRNGLPMILRSRTADA